ncbi:MAG TPA: hypothetical protein VFZ49_08455 [Pyrinomonadaceae bacterium]
MGAGDIAISPFSTLLEAYDVTVRIEADNEKIFEQVKAICREAFVGRLRFIDPGRANTGMYYRFSTLSDGKVEYDLDGVLSGTFKEGEGFARFLNSMIRAHVAGKSRSWVFIHAGVVEWRGKALIVPGQSRHGKTTLVSELIRAGAGYMSDEFAILDECGLVHPFDRDLAVRVAPDLGPVNISPYEFGGRRVTNPIEAGLVVFTRFVNNGAWKPETLTAGQGILEAVPQVIPFSFNTEFALKVLNTTFNRAIIVRSDRGEAKDTAPKILEYFDESLKTGTEALA